MKSFSDTLKEPETVADPYTEMRRETSPIYIYGAGSLAKGIYKKLQKEGIPVSGAVTDTGTETFQGQYAEKLAQLLRDGANRKLSLVLGFSVAYEKGFDKKRKELLDTGSVLHIYEIANPFDHHQHFDYSFVASNMEELERAYRLLEDDFSRECFSAFINSRITEDAKYVRDCFTKEFDEYDNELVRLQDLESRVFVDVGAYRGGGIARFIRSCQGQYEKIIGIEPERENYEELVAFCKREGFKNTQLHCVGYWYQQDTLCFSVGDECSRLDEMASVKIKVDTLDSICGEDAGITILNIGTGTSVKEILSGAKAIIRRDSPILRIFMGSAKEELYSVPQLIKDIEPSYRLYLRFAHAMPSRFFLYGIPGCRTDVRTEI